MLAHETIQGQAHELLKEIWNAKIPGRFEVSDCIAWKVIAKLTDLLEQSHDTPAEALRATVRHVVEEHQFVNDHGNCASQPVGIEEQVQVLVLVLEELRLRRIEQGHWSSMPNTPIMFG